MKLKITKNKIVIQENYGVFKTFVGDTYEAIGKFLKDSGKVLGNFTKLGFDLTSNITQGVLGLKSMSEMSMSIQKSTKNFNEDAGRNLKSLDDTTKMMLRNSGISDIEAEALMNLSLPGFFLSEMLNSSSKSNDSIKDIVDKSKETEIKNGYDRFIYLIFYQNFTGLNPKTASIDESCLQYIRNWVKTDLSFGENAVKFFEEACKLNKFHVNVKTLYTSIRAYIDLKDTTNNIDSKLSQSRKNFDNFFRSYQTRIKEDGDINNEYIGNIKTILIIVAYVILAENKEEIRTEFFKMTLPGKEEVRQEIDEINSDLDGIKTISVHCASTIYSIEEILKNKLKSSESVSSDNFVGNSSLLSYYNIRFNELSENVKNKEVSSKLLSLFKEDLNNFKTVFIEIENNIDSEQDEAGRQSILKTSFLQAISKLFDQVDNQISDISGINDDMKELGNTIEEKTRLIKDQIASDNYKELIESIMFLQNIIKQLKSMSSKVKKDITDISRRIEANSKSLNVVSDEDDSDKKNTENDDDTDNTLKIRNYRTEVT